MSPAGTSPRPGRSVGILVGVLVLVLLADAAAVGDRGRWRVSARPPAVGLRAATAGPSAPPDQVRTAVRTAALATSALCGTGAARMPGGGAAGSCPRLTPPTEATDPPPPPARSEPIGPADRWAVLVGVQAYAGSTHPTFGGRGDVAAVRTGLLRAGWRADHIVTLLDGAASGRALLDAMAWLAARSGPGTFTLFHFSGHVCIASRGPCAPGHTYLWGQDNTFIPESTVRSILGQVRGRAWFDFAGCEAGALDAGLSSQKRLVTGSSQASETAYEEPDWQESVWTGLVWDRGFLHGEAGAPPARASIGQMVAYGRATAAQLTVGQAAGAQHPYVAGGDPTQTLYAPRT